MMLKFTMRYTSGHTRDGKPVPDEDIVFAQVWASRREIASLINILARGLAHHPDNQLLRFDLHGYTLPEEEQPKNSPGG